MTVPENETNFVFFFQEQRRFVKTSVIVMPYNRESSFMNQIHSVNRASDKVCLKKNRMLNGFVPNFDTCGYSLLCCRQSGFFKLTGFSSTTWTGQFVLNSSETWQTGRIEIPVYFKYLRKTKTQDARSFTPTVDHKYCTGLRFLQSPLGERRSCIPGCGCSNHLAGWSSAAVVTLWLS